MVAATVDGGRKPLDEEGKAYWAGRLEWYAKRVAWKSRRRPIGRPVDRDENLSNVLRRLAVVLERKVDARMPEQKIESYLKRSMKMASLDRMHGCGFRGSIRGNPSLLPATTFSDLEDGGGSGFGREQEGDPSGRFPSRGPRPEEEAAVSELRSALRAAAASITAPRCRAVAEALWFGGESSAQVGGRLGISPNTVNRYAHDARILARAYLSERHPALLRDFGVEPSGDHEEGGA